MNHEAVTAAIENAYYEGNRVPAEFGVDYCFTPFVAVTKQIDGSFKLTIDWSESYQYSHDDSVDISKIHDAPFADEANDAISAFVRTVIGGRNEKDSDWEVEVMIRKEELKP